MPRANRYYSTRLLLFLNLEYKKEFQQDKLLIEEITLLIICATRKLVNSIEELKNRLRYFAEERDWDQFHSPKNLSMALIAESAELVEPFPMVHRRTVGNTSSR